MTQRRVVVTGMGVISPVGCTVEEYYNNLIKGKNGVGFITLFDTEDFKVKTAAEVKDFNPADYIKEKKEIKRLDRYTQFALAAAREALETAAIDMEAIDPYRFGCILGVGIGGLRTIEQNVEKLLTKGPRRVSPLYIPMAISNMASGNLAILAGTKGICSSVNTACAAASNAIGDSFKVIQRGDADIMITGGAEAGITPSGIAGFANMLALNSSNDINRSSIPFDKERSGFVMGEGSGILIIEELEHAKKRGATIFAEICGYGATCDANHITAPEGVGAQKAMEFAMKDGNVVPEDIDYINAHGTSTPLNDKVETWAIRQAFGKHVDDILVSSTKSMTGHLLGASGSIEAIAVVETLQNGLVPPTINYKVPDEECNLDVVPNTARKKVVSYALSNSFGFGGHNVSLLFRKWEN
jgi:3-oxoacyl-[acyl-carrier-protein] synthase II